ncbi:MAG: c-type cytochrome [Candidatus Rariloculaceae bacterium]
MKFLVSAAIANLAFSLAAFAQAPEWAYPVRDLSVTPPPVDMDAPRTVPGSDRYYTQTEIDNHWTPPVWFPEDFEPIPDVVLNGAGDHVRACAACHLTSGSGHPESSHLEGLTVGYMLQQMEDFASGARVDSNWMNEFAEAISEEDNLAAAEYYAAREPADWVDVVEAEIVPRTYMGEGRMIFVHPEGGTEPLGQRIIELPVDPELVTAGHPYSGFTAYAPVGSIARGEELATTGDNGMTVPCTICHGQDLNGLGDIPRIAGISPLYTIRQLYDFQAGVRAGPSAVLMTPTVANLSLDDMIALAAYLASLDP